MVRVGKPAISEGTSHRLAPVLPTRRIGPEVLEQVDQRVSGLLLYLEVLENKVESSAVRLIEGEAVGKPSGIAGHALKHC